MFFFALVLCCILTLQSFVLQQASGVQVQVASDAIGAAIVTRSSVDAAGITDYGCKVLATHRSYAVDSQVAQNGLLILEVKVEQSVYVRTKDDRLLSFDSVASLVKEGFRRGTGGNVDMKHALRRFSSFLTVVDTDLLEDFSSVEATVSPTRALTPQPTSSPLTPQPSSVEPTTRAPATMHPSTSTPTPRFAGPIEPPTGSPTVEPTASPVTRKPTSGSPVQSTSSPTSLRGASPTATPSRALATESPTTTSPVQVTSSPTYADIVAPGPSKSHNQTRGGIIIGAVVGGLAFLLVTLFFCCCVLPWCSHNKEDTDRNTNNRKHPEEVRHTTGSPDTKASSVTNGSQAQTNAYRLNLGPHLSQLRPMDSFDDSSLYTSTTSVAPNATGATTPSIEILGIDNRANKNTSSGMFSFFGGNSNTTTNNSNKRYHHSEVTTSEPTTTPTNGAILQSPSYKVDPYSKIKAGASVMSGTFSEASPNVDEDSTMMGFSAIYGQGNIGGSPMKPLENVEVQLKDDVEDGTREPPQTPMSTMDEDFLLNTPPLQREETNSLEKESNNSSLRSVLENGRKPRADRDVRSRVSAPSRLNSKSTKGSNTLVPPQDILADHLELENRYSLARKTARRGGLGSKSVGGAPFAPRSARDKMFDWSKKFSSSSSQKSSSMFSDYEIPLPMTPVSEQSSETGDAQDTTNYLTTAPCVPDTPEGYSTTSEDVSELPTPMSSPGILGISPAKDDSVDPLALIWNDAKKGATTSVSRGNSARTHRHKTKNGPSSFEADMERYRSPVVVNDSSEPVVVSGGNSIAGKSKHSTGVASITPRSLEQDLMRLEDRLAEMNPPLPDTQDFVTTSSITASEGGISRSSRSTRVSRRKRVVVEVPPGKLGIVLSKRHGRVLISEVRSTSPMHGVLTKGDKLGTFCLGVVVQLSWSMVSHTCYSRCRWARCERNVCH